MKKTVSLFSAFLILSGCSLFGGGEDSPFASQSTEFSDVIAQMHGAHVNAIIDMVPDYSSFPDKYTSEASVKGSVNVMEADEVDRINFEAEFVGSADLSDETSNMEGVYKVAGDMEGVEPAQGSMELAFKSLGQEMMISLKDVQASVNGQQFPIELLVGQHIDKWYSVTLQEYFDAIQEIVGQEMGEVNIADFPGFGESPKVMMQKVKNGMKELLMNCQVLKSSEFLGEQEEMLMYSVELDREKLEGCVEGYLDAILDFYEPLLPKMEFGLMERMIEGAIDEMSRELEKISAKGTLSVQKDDVRYFSLEATVSHEDDEDVTVAVELKYLEDEMLAVFTVEEKEGQKMGEFRFEKKGGDVSMVIRNDRDELMSFEKKEQEYEMVVEGKTLMKGKWSESEKTAEFFDPFFGEKMAEAVLTRSDDEKYELSIADTAGQFSMNMSSIVWDFDGDEQEFSAQMEIMVEDEVLFDGDMSFTMNADDTISIERPEEVEPLMDVIGQYSSLLNFGAPAADGSELSDEELEALSAELDGLPIDEAYDPSAEEELLAPEDIQIEGVEDLEALELTPEELEALEALYEMSPEDLESLEELYETDPEAFQ